MEENRIYLGLIGNRWTQEVMTALDERPCRFTELLHAITPPPSAKMLGVSLNRLQAHGLVVRGTAGDAPYELSAAGRALLPLVSDFQEELRRWQEEYAVGGSDTAQRPRVASQTQNKANRYPVEGSEHDADA
jgi:DNA-binding HxlR family transcriptional regulator